MEALDQQLHGYRNGHQLLSGTVKLPKADQDLVDRLSDVAGPLGPGEVFAPYLTCYPLPSESHYVIARTWQDLEAPRAGCVRTRSVLVPMSDWLALEDVAGVADIATRCGPEANAERRSPPPAFSIELPTVEGLQGVELVEAMFLEDRAPIVVFDGTQVDVIAMRLLAVLWPGIRKGFCVSTFCRSPRMIGRRSFDLVFAPKDARSRFAEWQGRRIDGRRQEGPRHHWAQVIVNCIFKSQRPSLRSLDALGEMSSDSVGNEAALRVSLLWNELQEKLNTSPNAVLGLLDIANTRTIRHVDAIRQLEPALALAAHKATSTMSPSDAWQFLSALTQKIGNLRLTLSVAKSIRSAAIELAAAHPLPTLDWLPSFAGDKQKELLTSAAGEGLSRVLDEPVQAAILRLSGSDFLDLLFSSATLAEKGLSRFPDFSIALARALRGADSRARDEAHRRLLRLLVDEQHVEPARILIATLNNKELISQTEYLFHANQLAAAGIRTVIVNRAYAVNAAWDLRSAVVSLGTCEGVDAMVEALITPSVADLDWLLDVAGVDDRLRSKIVLNLVRSASPIQLSEMLTSSRRLSNVIRLIDTDHCEEVDVLLKIATQAPMQLRELLGLVLKILPKIPRASAIEMANRTLDATLPVTLDPEHSNAVELLLSTSDADLNGSRAFRIGLERKVSTSAASRNLVAFSKSPSGARARLMQAIEDMARALVGRGVLDLSVRAIEAAASLLWESRMVNHNGYVRASAVLLPFLLNAKKKPASPLIAVAFPPVYFELQRENTPDFFNLVFMFLDWDKCKTARRQLVEAFLDSNWKPTDIALAAARAGDPARILARIARAQNGDSILSAIARDLDQIPEAWREAVQAAILEINKKD